MATKAKSKLLSVDNSPLTIIEALKAPSKALQAQRVPKAAIQKHPGRSDKVFEYIAHTWVTRTLNAFFQDNWNWTIVDTKLFDDNSASVTGELEYRFLAPIPAPDGSIKEFQYFTRKISTVGNFQIPSSTKEVANKAAVVSGAESRALVRAAMRAFNIGIEFYEKEERDEVVINNQFSVAAVSSAKRRGLSAQDVARICKFEKIESNQIVEKFELLGRCINLYASDPDYRARINNWFNEQAGKTEEKAE